MQLLDDRLSKLEQRCSVSEQRIDVLDAQQRVQADRLDETREKFAEWSGSVKEELANLKSSLQSRDSWKFLYGCILLLVVYILFSLINHE